MNRFKEAVNLQREGFVAALTRLRDDGVVRTESEMRTVARQYLKQYGNSLKTPPLRYGEVLESASEQVYLKDIKFHINSFNLKSNSLKDKVGLCVKDGMASLREMQRELIGLLSETTEEEIKLLGNFSKAHFNSFVRGIDSQLLWDDKRALRDFKTGYSFKEKDLMHVMPNAGLVLPIKDKVEIPILDVMVIDEATDVGDTVVPLQTSPVRNLLRKNKVFNHVVLRQEFDHSSRKYKRKTSYDAYPYSCVSTLTLELIMPSMVELNYLTFTPIGDSTIQIKQLSYKSEDGAEIALNSSVINSETSTTLLFQPTHMTHLRIQFEQQATVGRRRMVVGDKRLNAFNNMLNKTNMSLRFPDVRTEKPGLVYDFSLSDVSVGLASFNGRGYFRSANAIKVDSLLGFAWSSMLEQITPHDSFDTYLKSASLPDGQVILEGYVYAKLFGGKVGGAKVAPISGGGKQTKASDFLRDTLLLDAIVPIPDNYPIQVEYIEPVVDIAKVKLFPDSRWNTTQSVVNSLCLTQLEISAGGDYGLEGLIVDLPQSKITKIWQLLDIDREIVFPIYDNDNLPPESVYNPENWKHIFAKEQIEEAIAAITATRRGNLNKPYTIVYTAPSDEDLEHLLGGIWHKASESLKLLFRNKPEDYLLLDSQILKGGGKPLKERPGETTSLFARCALLPADSNVTKNMLGNTIANTKLVELIIENVDQSPSVDTVSIRLAAVREPISRNSKKLKSFSNKDRWLIERLSSLNYLANDLRDGMYEQILTIEELLPFSDGGGAAFVEDYYKSYVYKLYYSNAEKFMKWKTAILAGRPMYYRQQVSFAQEDFSATIGTDTFSWQEAQGFTGATNYFGCKFILSEGYKEYITSYGNAISSLGDLYWPQQDEDLLRLSKIVSSHKDWLFAYGIVAKDINAWGRSTKLHNYFKAFKGKIIPYSLWNFPLEYKAANWGTKDIDSTQSWVSDDSYWGQSNLAMGKLSTTGPWGTQRINHNGAEINKHEPGVPSTNWLNDSVEFQLWWNGAKWDGALDNTKRSLRYIFQLLNFRVWLPVWRFTTNDAHGLNIGDVVAFNTTPLAVLDGKYNIVNVNDKSFDVLAMDNHGYPMIRDLSPGGCLKKDISNFEFKKAHLEGEADDDCGLAAALIIAQRENLSLAFWNRSTNPHDWKLPSVLLCPKDENDSPRDWDEFFSSIDTQESNADYDFTYNCCNEPNMVENTIRCFDSGFQPEPIEVYEDDTLLTIGIDYDISLNNGADYLGFWPVESSTEVFWKKAAAGDFLIRFRNARASSIYWMKYRVYKNQNLSGDNKIFLKNGRVSCSEEVQNSSGTLNMLLVARTRTANPYITPIVRNYSLKIQEEPLVKRDSGKLEVDKIYSAKRKNSTHVS